jgi:glutathione S-transferase
MNLIISNDNLPDDIRQIIVEQFGVFAGVFKVISY